jgi:hypothetical protein
MIDKLIIQGVEYKPYISQETYLDLQVTNVNSVSLPAFNSVMIETNSNTQALAAYNIIYDSAKFACEVHALGVVFDAFGYVRELHDGYIVVDILPKDIVNKNVKLKDVLLRYADYFDLYSSGYGVGWNVDRSYAKCIANGGNRNNPANAKWFISTPYMNESVNSDCPIVTLRLKDVIGAIVSNARDADTLEPANIPDDIYLHSHLSMYRNLMQEFKELIGEPKIASYWRLTDSLNNGTWTFVLDFVQSEFMTESVSVGNTSVDMLKLPLRAWFTLSGFSIPATMLPYVSDFGIIYKLPNNSTRKVSLGTAYNLERVPISGRLGSAAVDYQFNYVDAVPCSLYIDINASSLYNGYINSNYTGTDSTKKIQYLNAVIDQFDIKLDVLGNAVDWYWCWRSVKEKDIYVNSTSQELEKEFFFELFAGEVTVSELLNDLYLHAGYAVRYNPLTGEVDGDLVDYQKPIKVLDYKLISVKPLNSIVSEGIFTGTEAVNPLTGQVVNTNIKYGTSAVLKNQSFPYVSYQFSNILNSRKEGKLQFASLQHNLFGEKEDKPEFIISKGIYKKVNFKGTSTVAHTQLYQNNDAYAIVPQNIASGNNVTQEKSLHACVAAAGAIAEFEFIGKKQELQEILDNANGLFAIDGIICIVEEIKGYNPLDGKGILTARVVTQYVRQNIT